VWQNDFRKAKMPFVLGAKAIFFLILLQNIVPDAINIRQGIFLPNEKKGWADFGM
jgi:hypothetical protein